MSNSTNLQLPYILAAQAQKHVTHNDAIRMLDAVVQISVLDRTLSAPPVSPVEGAAYIVASGATAEWSGRENEIAAFQDGAWMYYPPLEGWIAWSVGENLLLVYDGQAWQEVVANAVNPVSLAGINTTADTANRLSVKSDAVLFSHDDVTPGNGSIRHKLNKSSSLDTASLLFQDNWSGRAEMGLAGDDDFHFKVSADGNSWNEAILVDAATGFAGFPATPMNNNLLVNGNFTINQRGFAGGALAAGDYGHDQWKAGSAGADYTVSSSGTITLTSGEIMQIIESPGLAGQKITLSVEDLTGGNIVVDVEGVTGTITNGSGRRGVSMGIPSGSTGNISVKLSLVSGATSFSRLKLELGPVASPWFPLNSATELQRALRYFYRMDIAGYAEMFTGRAHSATETRALVNLPSAMRVAPAVSWGGDFSNWAVYAGGSFSYTTAVALWTATDTSVTLSLTTGSLPDKRAAAIRQGSATGSYIEFSAEL